MKYQTFRKAQIMAKFIRINVEGEIDSHIGSNIGNYVTLCGLDGDDPAIGQSTEKEGGEKITCEACRNIWNVCRNIKKLDFAK